MFENLTNKLENIFSKLKSAPSLTEDQVDSGLKEIRLALLEADVALQVVKDFIENVKPKAIGQEIIRSTSPGQMIVKIVYDELVNILGSKNEEINLKAVPPISLLLVGLQGSGKTTSAAKSASLISFNPVSTCVSFREGAFFSLEKIFSNLLVKLSNILYTQHLSH